MIYTLHTENVTKEKDDEIQDQKKDKKRDDNRHTHVHRTGDYNFIFIIINIRFAFFIKN